MWPWGYIVEHCVILCQCHFCFHNYITLTNQPLKTPNLLRDILSLVFVSLSKNSLRVYIPGTVNLGKENCIATFYLIEHTTRG